MTSQASLSLSLPLTKVTDAQYRKRFRASYNAALQRCIWWQNKGLTAFPNIECMCMVLTGQPDSPNQALVTLGTGQWDCPLRMPRLNWYCLVPSVSMVQAHHPPCTSTVNSSANEDGERERPVYEGKVLLCWKTHTHTHTHTQICTHARTHTRARTHTHARTHARMHSILDQGGENPRSLQRSAYSRHKPREAAGTDKSHRKQFNTVKEEIFVRY